MKWYFPNHQSCIPDTNTRFLRATNTRFPCFPYHMSTAVVWVLEPKRSSGALYLNEKHTNNICMHAGSHSAQQSYFDLTCFCQSTIIVSLNVVIHTFLQTNTKFSVNMLVLDISLSHFSPLSVQYKCPWGALICLYTKIVLLKAC